MITVRINKTTKLLFSDFLKSYGVIFLFDWIFTFVLKMDMTLLVYIGPFATAIYICENLNKHYATTALECIKAKLFWLCAIIGQLIYLTYTVQKGDLSINGVGLVFVIQLFFVFGGVLTAKLYQRVRG